MKARGFIVLDNPISNEGHLDSWHVLFVDLLTRDGWNVIALSTDPSGLARKLQAKGLKPGANLIVEGSDKPGGTGPMASARALWGRWADYLHTRRFESGQVHAESRGRVGRVSGKCANAAIAALGGLAGSAHATYRWIRRRTSTSGVAALETHLDPMGFCRRAQACIERHPGKVVAVFSMYVDAYMPQAASWPEFRLTPGVPWMGLCITPTGNPRLEGYYQAPTYRGTCFLDEAVARRYQTLLPEMQFAFLPDITETGLPDAPDPIALDIRRLAGDRRIVFMGGSIGKQKNLARWWGLILLADPTKWFFVQVGRINRNNLTPEDEAALDQMQATAPDNVFVFPDYLPDERAFNAIIKASDVVFAVYLDFARSSNMLSKAATFEKPILVADDHLMGARVRNYRIGLAVPSRDSAAVHAGLMALEEIADIKDNFRRYRDDFSQATMQASLSSFIVACASVRTH